MTVLFLLAGAALNVAIATAIVWFGRPQHFSSLTWAPREPWPERVPSSWEPEAAVDRERSFGVESAQAISHLDDRACFQQTLRAGWPVPALIAVENLETPNRPPGTPDLPSAAVAGTRGVARIGQHTFPIAPVWPGFLLNTLIYAAALFVLMVGPWIVRQGRRRRRGRCARCGYDLTGVPAAERVRVCPECGRSHAAR